MKKKIVLFLALVLMISTFAVFGVSAEETEPLTEYEQGYQDGYINGEEAGYIEGFLAGQNDGHFTGVEEGYESGYSTGYDHGYMEGIQKGKEIGIEQGRSDTIATVDGVQTMIIALFEAPYRFLVSFLDIEIFGISVISVLVTVVGLALFAFAFYIIVKFLKN